PSAFTGGLSIMMMPMRPRRSKLTGLSMAVRPLPVAPGGSIKTNRAFVNDAEFNSAQWKTLAVRTMMNGAASAAILHEGLHEYLIDQLVILPYDRQNKFHRGCMPTIQPREVSVQEGS
ncbi:MAG: hypothetical protein WBA88_24380, partial [Pseudaminobacter sp.]